MSVSASRLALRGVTSRGGYGIHHFARGPLPPTAIETLSRTIARTARQHTTNAVSLPRRKLSWRRINSRNTAYSTIFTPRAYFQKFRSRLFHTFRARRAVNPPKPNPTPHLGSPPKGENLTLSQRLKKLSREYGWVALGVYLGLSALDLPFCYLLVRYLGADRVGEWEHYIVSNISKIIPESVKSTYHSWRESMKGAEKQAVGNQEISEHVDMAGWGVQEAEQQNTNHASLATQLALAYAIHKSFIFIRVPITAAITPKVVKVLRGWGWDIGKRTSKAQKAINRGERSV